MSVNDLIVSDTVIELRGNWKKGYALDLHTKDSEYIGVDEFGYDRFNTKRTEVGELVYRIKYHNDISSVSKLVDIVQQNIRGLEMLDFLIPVPPSKQRKVQPVYLIASELSKRINIRLVKDVILKVKDTPQIKEIFDQKKRELMLTNITQNII